MRMLALLLAGGLTCVAAFGQEARPNALTAREAAEGWLLLFDGTSTFGWQVEGDARVVDGTLVVQGGTLTTTTEWGDGELSFELRGDKLDGVKMQHAPIPGSPGRARSDAWEQVRYTLKNPGRKRSAITFEVPAGSKLQLRTIKLRPAGLQSIFNGKDLSGWKEHPGKKSKFAVIDGAINIKDGPGDLQTEGQWGDFVLQLECKSNGKHLNSGVFFRCIPDLYQQGYEAQVRNEFTDMKRDYVLDDFDPATHKLVGKRKVQSPAIDFGTGAIYRRMPARSAAARDGEWFTMTVYANGRRLATWVNGIQQVDWTDHRPPADNARNGYRQAKGPISLQGHDPTTDLSFRNFRIAELP